MGDVNPSEIINRVDLFTSLSAAERARVADACARRVYQPGEVICREGDHGTTAYVVGSGEVEVEAGTPPVRVARMGSGTYFGEMSLLTGMPRTATVRARTLCEILELGRPVFMRLFATNVALAESISQTIAARNYERTTMLERRPVTAEAVPPPESTPHADLFARIRKVFGL